MSLPFAPVLVSLLLWASCPWAFAGQALVHGLWVWKTPSVLERSKAAEELRDFCKSQEINEVYLSISVKDGDAEFARIASLIGLLHQSGIRVEALYGSDDGDKPGPPRDAILARVRGIVEFNRRHPAERFDGIHLDIEPHQRAENKGAGNLKFLPDLVETFREVQALGEPAGLMVNADIPNKLLKGDLAERKMLFTSIPRFTLMLYEISSPSDGKSAAEKKERLRQLSGRYLSIAYEGLPDANVAKMGIALRTPDYGEMLPEMLKTLDAGFHGNPHYLGWSRHSYNDWLDTPR